MSVNQLLQIGLTEKEAQIYMALLRIGSAPASAIARRTNIKRATVYSALDALCAKGLLSTEEGSFGKRYIANEPECLMYALQKEKSIIQSKLNVAKYCIESLHESKRLNLFSDRKILYFYGADAILSSLKSQINNQNEIFFVFSDFGTGSASSKCIISFLKDLNLEHNLAYCSVPSAFIDIFCIQFKNIKALPFDCDFFDTSELFVKANVLIQDEKIFFIATEGGVSQMMQISDVLYSKYIKSLIVPFYFKNSCVLNANMI